MEFTVLALLPGLLIWLIILILPWRPWSTRESLDSKPPLKSQDLSNVTVLIPARNEAESISETLSALKKQGHGLSVVLVDDQSTDKTVEIAKSTNLDNLEILSGSVLPEGWSGKLWAMEQGRKSVKTPYLLLLDADIALAPGLISTLLEMLNENDLKMLSLMAQLKMQTNWEKLLMPAFIFFFKLLYPFNLSNKPKTPIAAAAGGCILLETCLLEKLGGFNCIKNALIDDCSLAKQFKQQGHNIWMGLTHSANSIRSYNSLSTIWQMVTRTAYTQLAYSPWLLLLCTILMVFAFALPITALIQLKLIPTSIGLLTFSLQAICYLPTLRYYSMNPCYVITLPFIGIMYLIMTWSSAFHYYFGTGAVWKDRHYN